MIPLIGGRALHQSRVALLALRDRILICAATLQHTGRLVPHPCESGGFAPPCLAACVVTSLRGFSFTTPLWAVAYGLSCQCSLASGLASRLSCYVVTLRCRLA